MKNQFLNHQTEVLKIATAGSVDDGKSTLIGRLLFDTGSLPSDKADAIRTDSKGMGLDYIDYSLATDGLSAEREQGITIDVAHIYFSTAKKHYIIADSPGHVEYTRNMITAASNASASIILVDARKGIVEQTERHFFINRFIRIKDVVVAVNKMDLIGYDEKKFKEIEKTFQSLTGGSKGLKIYFIPISALKGDNITKKSSAMAWYQGPTLLEYLEALKPSQLSSEAPLRFPIQNVIRPKKAEFHDFRGFAGKIYGSSIRIGDTVTLLPTMMQSKIKEIYFSENCYEEALPNSSVTVTLEDEVNLGRGDMIVKSDEFPGITNEIMANICWMDTRQKLKIGGKYFLRHTTRQILAKINDIKTLNDDFLKLKNKNSLSLNEIGQVSITLQQPIFYDPYGINKNIGSFILIDLQTFSTVAVGIIPK